jgi:hypothetical protein
MVERKEKQVRKGKTVDVCTTRVGPMAMMTCSRVSERFKKMGVRNVVVEQEGSYFVEYDSASGQNFQSLSDLVAVVLEELIKDGMFADCSIDVPMKTHILATFNVKVSVRAEKEKKQKKTKQVDDGDFRVARF